MGAVAATRVASAGPVSTTERVIVAWSHATPVARRATALAVGTSPILGAVAPARWPLAIGIGVAGTLLALAASVDLYEWRLPNRLLAAAGTALLLGVAVGWPTDGSASTVAALVGAVASGGLLLLARLRGGVGMGDVKAAAVVGAASGVLSLQLAMVAMAVATGSAALVGVARRRSALPLGPSLWLGWAVATAVASMGPWAR